jgi:hypothetical protein
MRYAKLLPPKCNYSRSSMELITEGAGILRRIHDKYMALTLIKYKTNVGLR